MKIRRLSKSVEVAQGNFQRRQMKKIICSLVLLFTTLGCGKQQQSTPLTTTSTSVALSPVSGPFTDQELQQFDALSPIDTHTHIYQNAPEFFALLQRLNIHVLDILVAHTSDQGALDKESEQAWQFVRASDGHATLCSTFNPFPYRQHGFTQTAIARIDHDFVQGAVSVKIWKNIGEQVKDAKGNYIMPDNPVFQPIYKDIAAHNKTLVAHLADPNTIWEAPNPAAADYSYYMAHPEWYMYKKANAPSKEAILLARDHLLEENPKLRVVGAHLGSMEADFNQLGQHLDHYPNFAVDMAARMPYFVMHARPDIIIFIEKYQDRLIYATDNGFSSEGRASETVQRWENSYAFDWRFLATTDWLVYRGHTVQGLGLPQPILRKLYHDNAIKWFPGILPDSH
jgi:hypothetical protein